MDQPHEVKAMNHPRLLTLTTCVVAFAMAACASTTFISSWKAPNQLPLDPHGQKVAAVFICMDEGSRRTAEDELVRKLNEHGASGVASYSLISGDELTDMERVKERLASAGVDGIVTLRVIDEKQKFTVTYDDSPPALAPYYWRFTDFWGYGWNRPYAPAEVTTSTILRIETLVYSLKRDTLLWAGTSRTTNPSKVTRLVEEVANAAAREMTKQGLLVAKGAGRNPPAA
jgi:hypothetical protein